EIAKQGIRLRIFAIAEFANVVEPIGTSDEQVFPTVVVKIKNAITPAGHFLRGSQSAGLCELVEFPIALIDEQRKGFVFDGRVPYVGTPVVVDIPKVGTHPRQGQSVGSISHS